MPLDPERRHTLMCLTQDGTGVPHSEQAERLCAAGARWVQLRMKGAPRPEWLAEARAAVRACRRHGAVLIVNDSVDIALESGADGAHMGARDGSWAEARAALGPGRILGGTVNDLGGVLLAASCGCLDYAGVGPLRFTPTKLKLAPVLGLDGVRDLIAALGGIPAWVIGGVEAGDLPDLRAVGAAGAAVSSAIHSGGDIEGGVRAFLAAWPGGARAGREAALLP
jgi:thiamine-phosphate pyrophosphorylase